MKDNKTLGQAMQTQVKRRSVLKAGAAGVAGGMLMPGAARVALADDKKPLGAWPAGSEGDSIVLGLTVDLTGPYSAQGAAQQRGYELAVEHINNGDPVLKEISADLKKGVLGKPLKIVSADAETKPNTGVQSATRFIHDNKAMMISGSTSSAVAIALEKVCNREHTPYFTAISGSNETTGVDCQRYGFRPCYFAYMACKAVAPVAAKELGKNRKAAYLTPDYTYGHTTTQSMKEFTEKEGWTTVTNQVHPLGAKDYSSYLINIANTDADVLVCVAYGADAANAIKQAKQFGLLDKMKVVVPYSSAYIEEEVGADLMEGVIVAQGFWWTLQDKYPQAKHFVDAYEKKFKGKPRDSSFYAYLAVMVWAAAVERAGGLYPPDVVKALESGAVLNLATGPFSIRPEDHQGVVNFPVMRGKKKADMKNPDDYYEIVQVVEGKDVVPDLGVLGCKLGDYI
ncbi:substrate-binding protein [Castellaniella hirudinis]|uniref:Substrate-binding protein n=1 Tax=Castellaniella hirudinis TaxID=1144617 RepID=A0ABV8S1B4_9BURK